MDTPLDFETLTLRRSPTMVWMSLIAVAVLVFFLALLAARLYDVQNWTGFSILAGGATFGAWLGWVIFKGRNCVVILTQDRFETSDGVCQVFFDDIGKLSVGTFEFKPAGGVLVRAKEKRPLYWQPGLIWVMGRSIGVGGMVPKAACKAFAEELSYRQNRTGEERRSGK